MVTNGHFFDDRLRQTHKLIVELTVVNKVIRSRD
jgi:hypothetical protein